MSEHFWLLINTSHPTPDDRLSPSCAAQRIPWYGSPIFHRGALSVFTENSMVMLVAKHLQYTIFNNFKPPNTSSEFIPVIKTIRSAFTQVLEDVKTEKCSSILDALIKDAVFPSPSHRLVLDFSLDFRCGDIGYLTGTAKKPVFVRLGNALEDSDEFPHLGLFNLDSEASENLEPKGAWSTHNDGERRRYNYPQLRRIRSPEYSRQIHFTSESPAQGLCPNRH